MHAQSKEQDRPWNSRPLTRRVAEAIRDFRYETLPAPVVEVAKHCFLDWLGVTLAGAREPDCADPQQTQIGQGANIAFEPRDTLRVESLAVARENFVPWSGGAMHLLALGALMRLQVRPGGGSISPPSTLTSAFSVADPLVSFRLSSAAARCDGGPCRRQRCGRRCGLRRLGHRQGRLHDGHLEGQAASQAAAIAHRVHGAMGFTREHALHYSTRRLWPFLAGHPQPSEELWSA